MLIAESIKKYIKESLFQCVDELVKENPDIKNRLNIKPGSYSISFNLRKSKDYTKFCEQNEALLLEKYNNLIAASGLQMIPSKDRKLAFSTFDLLVDDFFEYMVYYLAESEDKEKEFEDKFVIFENELESKSNKLEVIAHLKNIYFQGGSILENLIPWDDITITWARTAFMFRLLGWERQGDHNFEFLETFQPPWIILKGDIEIGSASDIQSKTRNIIGKFNLFTFVTRNEVGGNPYFNNVRLFGLGHYSPNGIMTTSLINVFDNDIHEEYGKAATLENPHDHFLSELLKKIDPNVYHQYDFIDWQMRMLGKMELNYRIEYSQKRTKYYLFQKLLNLISILNSLLPDMGNQDNQKNREEYIVEILAAKFSMDKTKVKETFQNTYTLRNKIVHGDVPKIDSIMKSKYSNIEILKEDLRFLEFILTRIINMTLVDQNFKLKEEQYFRSGNPSIVNI
jgi:hypothetical protein